MDCRRAVGGLAAVIVGRRWRSGMCEPSSSPVLRSARRVALNGVLVVRTGLSAFIVTLATASVCRPNLGLTRASVLLSARRLQSDRRPHGLWRAGAPAGDARDRCRALVRLQPHGPWPPDTGGGRHPRAAGSPRADRPQRIVVTRWRGSWPSRASSYRSPRRGAAVIGNDGCCNRSHGADHRQHAAVGRLPVDPWVIAGALLLTIVANGLISSTSTLRTQLFSVS